MTISNFNNKSLLNATPTGFTRLILGLSASLIIFPTNKALARTPSMYTYSDNLTLSYSQCKAKANNAAQLVFSKVKEPSEGDWGFQLFAKTAVTIGTLYCIEKPQGSTFIVVTSAYFSQHSSEAKSVRDRIRQIMLDQL